MTDIQIVIICAYAFLVIGLIASEIYARNIGKRDSKGQHGSPQGQSFIQP